jgi:hypothetical protein
MGDIYFPTGAFISLFGSVGGRMLALAAVGADGLLGVPVLFGSDVADVQGQVLIPAARCAWTPGDSHRSSQ